MKTFNLFKLFCAALAFVFAGFMDYGKGDVAGAAAAEKPSAVIFMYHRFGESDYPTTNITLEQLDAHIQELKSGGYNVLPVSSIVDAILTGTPLPDKAVGITVDDAFKSFLTHGWPKFKAAEFPVTLFISTDMSDEGQADYLSWDEVRQLVSEGLEIGHHTASHLHMPRASNATNRAEIEKAFLRLEKELGIKPDLFAFPYGEAGAAEIKILKDYGFKAAFGQHSGAAGTTDDPFYLPRFSLNERYGAIDRFRLAAGTLHLPISDMTPEDMVIRDNNPPIIGFTVDDSIKGLGALGCFVSHVGKASVERLGPRIEVRVDTPLPRGRTRLNCTMPAKDQRWYWLGRQYFHPG